MMCVRRSQMHRASTLSVSFVVFVLISCSSDVGGGAKRLSQDAGEESEASSEADGDRVLEAGASVVDSAMESIEPDGAVVCPRVRVTAAPGVRLFVRPAPNTDQAPVGYVYAGYVLTVLAEVDGQQIGDTTRWYQVRVGDDVGYVTGQYATCTDEPTFELSKPDAFFLPLACGKTTSISQGNHGSFSHTGLSAFAWDFRLPIGEPLTAIADGVVLHTYDKTEPGSACDGGGSTCQPYANHVVLLHGDDTTSTYRHLSEVRVDEGMAVLRGQTVGLSGQTGWSTGPHAHVQRMENCDSSFPPDGPVCQSISTSFADVPGNGIPQEGQSVTSANCR